MKKRVLILCTGNSVRSQMAEGLLRAMSRGRVEVRSAGTHPVGLNSLAVQAMAELKIDISGQRSKSLEEFRGQAFDVVITVCDAARQACPTFPAGTRQLHWNLPDPAQAAGSEPERLEVFRRVRDTLAQHVKEFLSADMI